MIFVATVWTIMGEEYALDASGLYKMILVAFVSVLPVLVHVYKETISRTQIIIRQILHLVLTAGLTLGLLVYFEWLVAENAVATVIFFLTIYIIAYTVQAMRAKKLADKLNEKLNAFHNSENATRDD
jgi:hypothetical protein